MLPYHVDRARKRWQRQTRIGAAIALFGLGACSADTTSSFFTWPDETSRQATSTQPLTIDVAPLSGVSRENADTLADALREQTDSRTLNGAQISAVLGASRKSDGLYIVTIIDLKDKSGARVNRVMDEKLIQTEASTGTAIPQSELKRVASAAAEKLAASPTQLARTETRTDAPAQADNAQDDGLTTASITPPLDVPDFSISVGPTPGDGGAALTDALQKALAERAPSMRIGGQYRIDGRVKTASALNGEAQVSIEWLVSTADGRRLGAITQKNNLSPESISGRWDQVATDAGKAAANGVLALLDAGKPRS